MHIETVLGAVRPEQLGATLMHEHIDSVALPGFHNGGDDSGIEDLTVQALNCLADLGVGTLVDLTGRGRAGNFEGLALIRRLALRLPFHVVVGFSYYKDPWLEAAGRYDLDRLTKIFVNHARTGFHGAKAGIYGEVGTSLDEITPREEMQLRAVARAQLVTGLAIYTHCTLGTMALEQADLLVAEGADMSRVVLGHLDLRSDVDYLEQVLATGATLGFDTFGKEWFDYRVTNSEDQGGGSYIKWTYHRPDDDRVAALVELCARGHADRIVLSCDMSGAEAWLNPSTHGHHGYSYMHRIVLPRLREEGISDASLLQMLERNPVRILAIP